MVYVGIEAAKLVSLEIDMVRTGIMLMAGLLAGPLRGPVAGAQAPSAAGVPVGCTFATCALRVEPVFFGAQLVRGASGEPVSRLGGFGGGVEPLLTGPDSAAAYGRSYVRATQRAAALGLAAAIAYTVVLVRTDNFRNARFSDADVITAVAGAGFVLASMPFTVRAQRHLSRAIWWYNSALPR